MAAAAARRAGAAARAVMAARAVLTARTVVAAQHAAAAAAVRTVATGAPGRVIVGAGSNVIDAFYPVRKLPLPGEKTYFAQEQFLADTLVGGVTLNHLAWARALGAPTALLALQGADANGAAIRAKLAALGVGTQYVRVSPAYTTSVSHVLVEEGGERSIIMAPASTSQLTAAKVVAEFGAAVAAAAMVTTEVSQVPLSGVEALLDGAAAAGVPSLLDVDVTPSVATGAARLGTRHELTRVVGKATLLKVTGAAAAELLALVSSAPLAPSLEAAAAQLADAYGARLVVITDGSRGAALALGKGAAVGAQRSVRVPIYAGVTQVDATGAGDAYFGGLVAGIHAWGFPTTPDAAARVGALGAAAGAACVEVRGALPVEGVSGARMAGLNADAARLVAGAGLPSAPAAAAAAPAPAPAAHVTPAVHAAGASLAADIRALQALHSVYAPDTVLPVHAAGLQAAVAALAACTTRGAGGHAYVIGIGKSAAVAGRLAVSLRSVGVAASAVHGAELFHGDFGTLRAGDVALLLSHSGRTPELVAAATRLRAAGVTTIAVTDNEVSPLAAASHARLYTAVDDDDELLAKVPSRSVVAQEAIGNALLAAVVDAGRVTVADFMANHPGGAIGAST